MKIVTIETKSNEIGFDAEMLKLKAEYHDKGFSIFPKNLILEYCPFETYKQVDRWVNEMGNVWRLRNRNSELVLIFKKALEKIKHE